MPKANSTHSARNSGKSSSPVTKGNGSGTRTGSVNQSRSSVVNIKFRTK